jgi:hypothetical protein
MANEIDVTTSRSEPRKQNRFRVFHEEWVFQLVLLIAVVGVVLDAALRLNSPSLV